MRRGKDLLRGVDQARILDDGRRRVTLAMQRRFTLGDESSPRRSPEDEGQGQGKCDDNTKKASFISKHDVHMPKGAVPRSESFVYTGPFSAAVRKVKKLSIFSCACAVASGPVMLALEGPTTATLTLGSTLAGFGIFTTGLMHWFTSPYTHRLEYDPKTDLVRVEGLNFFARPIHFEFHLGDVKPADSVHPLTSFKVPYENGYAMLYVDESNFGDKELLARLVPSATDGTLENSSLDSEDMQKC